MRVHFIAIGGAAMHNLAIALKRKGFEVTGSDDKIFDPSKSRLEKEGLLPSEFGWFPEKLDSSIDAIILGMHAREDNPELLKAREIGLTVYSYPEYIYNETKDKKRVVIGGSHGKTSITAMILHVLNELKIEADYMVGAQLDGFDCMVKLTDEAPIVILEGDEYLSSPIDRRPKFHWYKPHTALLTGVAWDHINVFPTFENYVSQFQIFAESILENGTLVYYEGDEQLRKIVAQIDHITCAPYDSPTYSISDGMTSVSHADGSTALQIFGEHNLQNLSGARLVCKDLGISDHDFYESMASFSGAARRLELVKRTVSSVVYKDFAHSPSKLKATTTALKEQYPDRQLIACMELHTFSSLNKEFLSEYNGAMAKADKAYVYFDPAVVAHKKLEPVSKEEVAEAFGGQNVTVFEDVSQMLEQLRSENWNQKNLLMMSSGTFKGTNYQDLAEELIG